MLKFGNKTKSAEGGPKTFTLGWTASVQYGSEDDKALQALASDNGISVQGIKHATRQAAIDAVNAVLAGLEKK